MAFASSTTSLSTSSCVSSSSRASVLTVKVPAAQKLWEGLSKVSSRFFTADADGSDDLLVEVVRRDPTAATCFLRAVMIFSGVAGIVVSSICAIYLALFWSQSGRCDRPLRWWLLVHGVLQLLQAPVRFVLLSRIRSAELSRSSMEECVASFTSSPAWRASKQVSLFTYGWFVLGIVWVVNAGNCAACPGLLWITMFVLVQAVARAIAALCCYRRWFPTEATRESSPRVEVATAQQIAALPVVLFSKDLFDEPGASCAVCLSEYVVDERLRRLPCGHYFHRKCTDEWLRRSKRCPLCIRGIDEATCSHFPCKKAN